MLHTKQKLQQISYYHLTNQFQRKENTTNSLIHITVIPNLCNFTSKKPLIIQSQFDKISQLKIYSCKKLKKLLNESMLQLMPTYTKLSY